MYDIFVTVAVFFTVYIFIISEKIHRTIASMIGAASLIFLQIFENPHEVYIRYVDFDTVFLLIGMMLFVAAMKRTGFFQYLGIKGLKISRGSPKLLFFILTAIVAVVSAFIDNVTTILIFVPMTLAVTDVIGIDPSPFVLGEIFASNIGGTATLIGDPPNIIIGTNAHLSFSDFLVNLAPVSFMIFLIVDVFLMLVYRKELSLDLKSIIREDMFREERNPKLFMGELLLGTTIALFLLQHKLNISGSSIALMMGFLSVLVIERDQLEEFLREVDWETIFFFVALFIITGALEETGILEKMAYFMVDLAGNSLKKFEMILISFSASLSAFVDNIPYTATMVHVINHLKDIDPKTFYDLNPLWWSLALGACLGGNGTPIGASANVVGLQILLQNGKKIKFWKFSMVGLSVVILSVLVASVYVYIRY